MSEIDYWYLAHPHVSLPYSVVLCHYHIWLQWEFSETIRDKKGAKETTILLQYAPSTGRWMWCGYVEVSVSQYCLVLTKLSVYPANSVELWQSTILHGEGGEDTHKYWWTHHVFPRRVISRSSLCGEWFDLRVTIQHWFSNSFVVAGKVMLSSKNIADIRTSNVLAWIEWRGMSPHFI